MDRDESAKKVFPIDIYMIFLLPLIVFLLMFFSVIIDRNAQINTRVQGDVKAIEEEIARPVLLPEKLPHVCTIDKLYGKTESTSI